MLERCIDSVLAQTFKDFELIFMDNSSGDGSVEFVKKKYPQVKIAANQVNLGFAGGHNLFFSQSQNEYLMLLNPDVELTPTFLEEAVKGFESEKVGAVSGRLLRPDSKIIDSTGIVVNLARRGRDRGQWKEDLGQYDKKTQVFGVNGAASIFKKSALEKVKMPIDLSFVSSSTSEEENKKRACEYFDEDFFAYWEDFDLSWRLNLAGFECVFVPKAVAYHERKAGQSRGGYLKFFTFMKHHKNLPLDVKKWNWKNHLFCVVKNDFDWELAKSLPFLITREFLMLIYILIFETGVLLVVPQFFRQLPRMIKKRHYIKAQIRL